MSMPEKIKKRNGRTVRFDVNKVASAIFKAAESVGGTDKELSKSIAEKVSETVLASSVGGVPTIEDVQNAVEKVLIDGGHARTAKAFILYRNKRDEVRAKTKVRKTVKKKSSTTDQQLLVDSDSQTEYHEWNKQRVADTLVGECGLDPEEATTIASEVERRIIASGIHRVGTTLIRELVNNELFERGHTKIMSKQSVIGFTESELTNLIMSKGNENSNITANNPEAINFTISETILKKYALSSVFSEDVGDAHKTGMVHIHDMGHPCQYYCSGHSIEYIKKYGLQLGNLDTSSGPAKYARTLTGHINTFIASMQSYYAGALGLGAVNILYAPYLEGMTDKELVQEAQHLIFSSAQNAFSRGNQVVFTDHNVHIGVPDHLKNVNAIGPCGKYTGKVYGDYEETSNRFLKAMMEVWDSGDQYGRIMSFPKMDIHICESVFINPEHKKLFMYACEIASRNGLPYFVFDRDGVSISMCCRLKTQVAQEMLDKPELQNFVGFQNVTVNLPQCAYRAGSGKTRKLYAEVDKAMEVCLKAHLQKKAYVEKLMNSPNMPLWELGKPSCNGIPYVDLDKATYIIGMIGLNECVQHMIGKELHEDDDALQAGLRIISHMYYTVKEFGTRHGLKFTLEESPAESASRRFARIDLRMYPEASKYVKGSIEDDECFYSNSVHINAAAKVDIVQRIVKQSKFHNLIESGAIIHAFVGENRPSAEAIAKLVELTYRKTNAAQITISPEFTVCKKCKRMIPGMSMRCSCCGAENIKAQRGFVVPDGSWTKENLGRIKKG